MDIITLALCKRMGKSKADIDGVYPNLIAGGVVESEVRDEGFSNKVTEHTGTAYINSIKGNTLAWNQLVPTDWVQTKTFSDGFSVTNNSDGSYTLNGTTTQSRFPTTSTEIKGIQGHKYYIQLLSSQSKATISQNSSTVYVYSNGIYTAQNNNVFVIYFNVNTYSNEKIVPMIIDLTQMFGSGNEPTTVEEFTSLFSFSYYDFNQGTLLSFNGTGIKTVGFNQWDEEWEQGTISTSTGENASSTTRIRSKNYIPVLLGKTYYCKAPNNVYVFFYDGAFNYLGYSSSNKKDTTFEIEHNASYIRFRLDNDGADYENNVCINISNTELNGNYEPYTESTLSLPISSYFPTGMKSAGTAYDELTPTKAITRIGAVDLGSLTWGYNSENAYFTTNEISSLYKVPSSNLTVANIICSKHTTISANNLVSNGQLGIAIRSNGTLMVKDTNYTDATAFKTAMSGVMLYYELVSESEVDVNLSLSYKTYEGGTEQLLPENGSVPVTSPMKTNVEFDFDENINALLGKMLNMIAPVETSPTSNAYSIGQYLIYDYVLYKVTSAIASGGTITVGTNVEATTIASVLESL